MIMEALLMALDKGYEIKFFKLSKGNNLQITAERPEPDGYNCQMSSHLDFGFIHGDPNKSREALVTELIYTLVRDMESLRA